MATSLQTPPGATRLTLTIYASPNSYGNTHVTLAYDNFNLVEVPNIAQTYHLVTPSNPALAAPAAVTYDAASPTKKYITVQGASKPFYLTMNETFDNHWRLDQGTLNNSWISRLPIQHPHSVAGANHFAINGGLNAWYIDPSNLCRTDGPATGCTKNADGSYDLRLTAEFTPQRWFNAGLAVSAAAFSGCIGFLGYRWIRYRQGRDY